MSKLKIFFLLLLCVTLAYGASIQYGFSQDDWFHLSISQASNLQEFLNFFNPAGVTWIFFRPLSTQVPYWLSTSLFSLSTAPYFMHATMLLIHALNAYLVVIISRKYLRSNASILLGIFYAISSIHFLSLFYIGAIQQLISTFFSLLAIYLFLKRPRPNQLSLAILTLCALLSKELALRLPMILFVLAYLCEKNILRSLRAITGPLCVAILYILLRVIFDTGVAPEYAVVLSPATTLATTMWYALFSLGFPEEILRYGLSGGLINFVGFLRLDPVARLPIFVGAFILLFYVIHQLVLSVRLKQNRHQLAFLALAFLNILAIIFLPTHRYPHYLDLSLLFIGIWLLRNLSKINFSVIIFSLLVGLGMFCSIWVETTTHWTIKRAILARTQMTNILSNQACQNPEGIVFEGSKQDLLELSYAMSIANGPRVICQNPSLQVYYKTLP